MTENRTVQKSNNQGAREETFIQTSRRGGDRQPGRGGLLSGLRLADPARWWIVESGGQSSSWPERQQLVDCMTDLATQSSSSGK